jgi:hypothetical protein
VDFVVCNMLSVVCLKRHANFLLSSLFPLVNNCVMDMIAPGHSGVVDADIYEYRDDTLRPIDVGVLGQGGTPFNLAISDSSSQGAGSQQSSLQQNFYRASGQQSSLTSSEGVGVSAVFLCQSQSVDWLMVQEHGLLSQLFRRSDSQHLLAYWGNVCLLSCIQVHF